MFENNDNMNDFDLMMKSVLEEGREEVPAGVWDRVSEGLDRIDASRKKPVLIWFRRAGIASVAAAAAIVAGVLLNHSGNDGLVPDAGDSGLVAVVEPEVTEAVIDDPEATVEEKAASSAILLAEVKNTSVDRQAAEIPETALDFMETQTGESTEAVSHEAAAGQQEKVKVEVEEPEIEEPVYFPEDWGEEQENFRPRTSIVLSGLAGTNSAQVQNRIGPQKAPVVTPAPDRTGIKETSTKSTYGIPVSAGVGVKVALSPRWSVGTGVNYTMLTRRFYGKYTQVNPSGAIELAVSSDIRNTQHYVGVPVNAYFNIIEQDRVSLYAYGGGCIEKCVSDDYDVLNTSIFHTEKVKGVQLSANAGIGVEFALGRHVGLYIDPSLRYYFDNGQPNSIRTAQPLMFGFETGLRVNL